MDGLRSARVAVSYIFFACGMIFGMWFVHIPVVTARLALEPAVLGLALLMVGLGAQAAPPVAALLVQRFGSRLTTRVLAILFCLWMQIAILAPHVIVLFVATVTGGVLAGTLNVAMNTQGAEVEAARGKPTMSSFHGFFSLGGLCSAGLGGLFYTWGLGDGRGALAVGIALAFGSFWFGASLLPDRPRVPTAPNSPGPGFALPGTALLTLCLIGMLCTLVEGSVGDWSALYLIRDKLTTPAIATTGYLMFSLAMTVSRFAGDGVVSRMGARNLIVFGGVLIILGMAIVLVAPWPVVSATGFLVIGLGAANVSPLLIGAASRTPGVPPAVGVATVSTAITAGLLLGPPIVGFVAQASGLTFALGVVGACGIVIGTAAALRKWPSEAPVTAPV